MNDILEALKHCDEIGTCSDCPMYFGDAMDCIGEMIRLAIKEIETLRCPDVPIYDQEEIYHNCTVQVLYSSETGDSSVGWWKGEVP